MNADTEFNALSSLYQGVMHDLKSMYPTWENASHKAFKLSAQLKSTLSCVSAFIDSLQAVADTANNIKGSTRDMGACMTRLCIRQRSIESHLRSFADTLTNQFALSLQGKGSHFKHQMMELDRHALKFCRKVRSRKGGIDDQAVLEQRSICQKLLSDQRNQVTFFLSALLPVFNSELNILDEVNNLRQIGENLESLVHSCDSSKQIDTILDDIRQGDEHSWRNCLSQVADRSSMVQSHDDVSFRCPSPSPSTFTWPSAMDVGATSRGHTISFGNQPRRTNIMCHAYLQPQSTDHYSLPHKKPPIPKKNISCSVPASSVGSDIGGSCYEQRSMQFCNSDALSASSAEITFDGTLGRPRPISFACDESVFTPHRQIMTQCRQNCDSDRFILPNPVKANSLISETIEQIDKLGFELDSYCKVATAQSVMMSQQQGIRLRSGSCKPPPPPERRNSTITSATSSAPSVADLRAARSMHSEYVFAIPQLPSDMVRENCSSQVL